MLTTEGTACVVLVGRDTVLGTVVLLFVTLKVENPTGGSGAAKDSVCVALLETAAISSELGLPPR